MDHTHGTWQRYVSGRCRCRACRRAWREYMTTRRRARGMRPRGEALERSDIRHTEAVVQSAVAAGADPKMPVTLSPLGGQILVAIQQRTGRSRGAVLDELLREHGTDAG